jgi:hypothetical protein
LLPTTLLFLLSLLMLFVHDDYGTSAVAGSAQLLTDAGVHTIAYTPVVACVPAAVACP